MKKEESPRNFSIASPRTEIGRFEKNQPAKNWRYKKQQQEDEEAEEEGGKGGGTHHARSPGASFRL